ncbi:hypothetical protein ACMFMG_006541 [Clarireedia jacksonii]
MLWVGLTLTVLGGNANWEWDGLGGVGGVGEVHLIWRFIPYSCLFTEHATQYLASIHLHEHEGGGGSLVGIGRKDEEERRGNGRRKEKYFLSSQYYIILSIAHETGSKLELDHR